MMNSRRFVLVDRDGTLIVERNYLADPAGVELLPGAVEGLKVLRDAGLGIVLVTNQSGIARGYFTEDTLHRIHERLMGLLEEHGLSLDGIYHCPHGPDDACACRKPHTGMAIQAAADLGFDAHRSFVVGDNVGDIGLGRNIGAVSILVRTGHGARVLEAGPSDAHHVVNDFGEAAALILRLMRAEAT